MPESLGRMQSVVPHSGKAGNLKMGDSGILTVFEIEQLKPCKYFGKGLCRNCYAEKLHRMRKQTDKHIHKATPMVGIRCLGTYKEITEEDWRDYKAGRGLCAQCGQPWFRTDFPTAHYFLITRGLESEGFYQEVMEDPACHNIQVSVDIYPELDFEMRPSLERLEWFARNPKTMFRFKTTRHNVMAFIKLADKLGLTEERRKWVMETPLRLPDQPHAYRTTTYLEAAGWDSRTFGCCNTSCEDCPKENGGLLCAVTPASLMKMFRPMPVRVVYPGGISPEQMMRNIDWRADTTMAMRENGGTASLSWLYAWFLTKYPILAHGKPNWQFKIRQQVQKVGTRVTRGQWALLPQFAEIPLEAAMPMAVARRAN